MVLMNIHTDEDVIHQQVIHSGRLPYVCPYVTWKRCITLQHYCSII